MLFNPRQTAILPWWHLIFGPWSFVFWKLPNARACDVAVCSIVGILNVLAIAFCVRKNARGKHVLLLKILLAVWFMFSLSHFCYWA